MNIIIEPRMQRTITDCGFTCLEMLLNESYVDIKGRRQIVDGLTPTQMKTIAKRLGKPLVYRDIPDLEEEEETVGILFVQNTHVKNDRHAVIFGKGTIYDPANGQWWLDADQYMASKGYVPYGLLVRRDV